MIDERRKEGAQECRILIAVRVRVPAKEFLVLAVHGCHDLRRVLCSPLSEEMRYLNVFNSASVEHIYPAVEQGKVKGILATVTLHTHELSGSSLTAYRSIERGSEDGGQKHIDAVLSRRSCEVLYDLKVPVRPYLEVVVVCQTVRVEPLCKVDVLIGKHRVDDLHLEGGLCAAVLSTVNLNGELVHTRRHILRDIDLNPYRVESILREGDRSSVVKGTEHVGVETGSGLEIVVVESEQVVGEGYGNVHHLSEICIFYQLTRELGSELGRDVGHRAALCVIRGSYLEADTLTLERRKALQLGISLYTFVDKHLLKRGDNSCFDHK